MSAQARLGESPGREDGMTTERTLEDIGLVELVEALETAELTGARLLAPEVSAALTLLKAFHETLHVDCGCRENPAYLRGLEEGDAAGYERGLEEARTGAGFGTA